MKKFYLSIVALLATTNIFAQGWPANYDGVMLQGFYWDSYRDSKWTNLESQADELSQYFKLVWIPQSANCGGKSMGYNDLYWFTNYNSSFGTEKELRSLINTFKNKGIGTIADVVINHRNTLTNWIDFPVETYNGVTYKMESTDICANDDKGETKKWADENGYKLSSYNDTGEGWDGMRDLDHNSSNVQKIVKAYLNMLLQDLGYAGFRYDMTKGYAGKFTGIYNDATKPTYSVGEYWDGNATTVKNWLDATKINGQITSAVFDFPIRYSVRDAINANWNSDINGGIATDNTYKRYAVTFVENHDTQYRSSSEQNDPIKKDIAAANAFILAASGTPCIFYKHWLTYKKDIKMMINARKVAGITSNSVTSLNLYRGNNFRAISTKGATTSLLAVMGSGAKNFSVPNTYQEIISGDNYRYFLPKKTKIAWVDLPSGDYEEEQKAKLVAVTNNSDAKLVYTTDGTNPSASSKQVANGTEITIPFGKTTLKVGLLSSGTVSSIISREYNITKPKEFVPYDITVYVNADKLGWTNGINFWAWEDASGVNLTASKTWPGDMVTQTKTINGKKWYYQTYNIKNRKYMISLVFSLSNGEKTIPQTDDIADLTKDTYLEIQNNPKSDAAQKYYEVTDVTDEILSGISNAPITENVAPKDNAWYTLSGMKMIEKPNQAGIYIHQGKKVIIK